MLSVKRKTRYRSREFHPIVFEVMEYKSNLGEIPNFGIKISAETTKISL